MLERDVLRDVNDEIGNGKDHIARMTILTHLSVDTEPDVHRRRQIQHALIDEISARTRVIEAFGEQPRMTLLLQFVLNLSRCHVQGKTVTTDVLLGFFSRDIAALLIDHNA